MSQGLHQSARNPLVMASSSQNCELMISVKKRLFLFCRTKTWPCLMVCVCPSDQPGSKDMALLNDVCLFI